MQVPAMSRRGFTLVELLVVIAIIGILVSLMMPAIGTVRESGRRLQCKNNLQNVGVAVQSHITAFNRFPSGGWGWSWAGEPERGTGPNQPGGWIFNLLQFIEQEPLRNLGKDLTGTARADAIKQRCTTPLALFNCPSRRPLQAWPDSHGSFYRTSDNTSMNFGVAARTDYAINAGSKNENEIDNGPTSLAGGDTLTPSTQNGICYRKSEVTPAHVARDGMSNTYLVAEKYLNPASYETGSDSADNENMYVGYVNDQHRAANQVPLRDRDGAANTLTYGSCHSVGFQAVMCDRSVRNIGFGIDLTIHQRLANRADGGGAIDFDTL